MASHFCTEWNPGPRPRILVLRARTNIPNLARIKSSDDFEVYARYDYRIGGGSEEMAEAICSAGWNGWYIEDNYPDGDDIMLCDTGWLEYVETLPVS